MAPSLLINKTHDEKNLIISGLLHWLDVFCQLQERPRVAQHQRPA